MKEDPAVDEMNPEDERRRRIEVVRPLVETAIVALEAEAFHAPTSLPGGRSSRRDL